MRTIDLNQKGRYPEMIISPNELNTRALLHKDVTSDIFIITKIFLQNCCASLINE